MKFDKLYESLTKQFVEDSDRRVESRADLDNFAIELFNDLFKTDDFDLTNEQLNGIIDEVEKKLTAKGKIDWSEAAGLLTKILNDMKSEKI